MSGQEAVTFAMMVAVLPLFLLVFGTVLFLASPVLFVVWLALTIREARASWKSR